MNKLRLLEFEGLAPSVFCGTYFADLGADVCIIARHEEAPFGIPIHDNLLNRNKKCICLSLKSHNDILIIKYLLRDTDILIDSFRPGVLEKVGLGPEEIHKINKGVVILRVSGYGQEGELAMRPGHDLNYIAVSGFLSKIGNKKPSFPNNYLADFAACSLGIYGTMVALLERDRTGKGQVVDCSLMHGTRYLSLPLHGSKEKPYLITSKEGEQAVVTQGQSEGDAPLSTKIVDLLSLQHETTPLNYFSQGMMSPASNASGFHISSPFTTQPPSTVFPTRNQHTLQYLQSRHVPQQLIDASLNPSPKL